MKASELVVWTAAALGVGAGSVELYHAGSAKPVPPTAAELRVEVHDPGSGKAVGVVATEADLSESGLKLWYGSGASQQVPVRGVVVVRPNTVEGGE